MKDHRAKIKTIDDAQTEIGLLKKRGKKIIFTNGCFDILHIGHVRYLYEAKTLGDHLIVAVNSDKSVRTLKGSERPVINENERVEMVASLGCVDTVVIFDEETPYEIIRKIMPHVLVKGGDWKEEDIIGADIVKAAGGEVRSITFTKGSSTTGIIDKIKGGGIMINKNEGFSLEAMNNLALELSDLMDAYKINVKVESCCHEGHLYNYFTAHYIGRHGYINDWGKRFDTWEELLKGVEEVKKAYKNIVVEK